MERTYRANERSGAANKTAGKSRKQEKKKISKFWIGLLIFVLVAFVAILIFLLWFFNWLSDYENSERHHVIEGVVSMCDAGEYEEIAGMTDVVLSGLETREVYAEEIGKLMRGKTITYQKAFSYDRFEKPTYKLLADGEYVCKLVLKKAGKSKYNFDTYAPDYFTAFDFGVGSVAFLIPDYYEVYCNGKLLDSKFIVQEGLNPELLKYALTDTDGHALSKYEVSGLTSKCEIVAVDEYGGNVTLTEKGGVYSAEFGSMRFSVPAGVSIYVGNVKLGSKYVTEGFDGAGSGSGTSTDENAFAPLLYVGSSASGYVNYRVDYVSPDLTYRAIDADGRDVELRLGSDGVYTTGVTEYAVTVPEGWKVTAGDVILSDSEKWLSERGGVVEELSTIKEKYLPDRPTMCTYRFSVIGDNGAPQISLVNAVGDVEILSEGPDNTFSYDFVVDRDVPELTSLAMSRTKSYAEYITNDMGHDEFMAMILEDQPMYDELKDNPYYFYTGHKKHWFENESWSGLKVYSEKCFSCEVKFDYYIGQIKTNADFVKMLPLDIRFWFVNYQGKWYMADWEISS